ELEEEIYGHDHDHDDDDDEDDDDEDDDEETNFVEMECPKCKETVYFEEDFLYDDDVEVACPECGATIYKTGSSGEDKADAGAGSSSSPSRAQGFPLQPTTRCCRDGWARPPLAGAFSVMACPAVMACPGPS